MITFKQILKTAKTSVCVADFASLQVFAERHQSVPKLAGKL